MPKPLFSVRGMRRKRRLTRDKPQMANRPVHVRCFAGDRHAPSVPADCDGCSPHAHRHPNMCNAHTGMRVEAKDVLRSTHVNTGEHCMSGFEEAPNAILSAARAGRVGEVIRLCRQAQGLTQGKLSTRVGCNQSTISRIERGKCPPDINTLRNLADQLCIPSVLVGLADRSNTRKTAPPIEAPVKRREFLQAAAALAGSASLPAESEPSLTAIHTITVAQRRLDATTP